MNENLYALLYLLPKNAVSYLFGRIASIPLPKRLAGSVNRLYCRLYKVRVDECEFPPEHYSSLQQFFTRNLRAGIRPIGAAPISPVDGSLNQFGKIENGTLLQAKGRLFTVQRLLSDPEASKCFRNGYFQTFYLAPKDYHHIHSPVDGVIDSMLYVPGKLWPVNEWSVSRIEELFAVNERIITFLQTDAGRVAVVKVGATNVGSISLSYDSFRSNSFSRVCTPAPELKKVVYSAPIPVSRGARIATFNLGSTVIVLYENERFRPLEPPARGDIRFGEPVGIFQTS